MAVRGVRIALLDRGEDGLMFGQRGLDGSWNPQRALEPVGQEGLDTLEQAVEDDVLGDRGDLQVEGDVRSHESLDVIARVTHPVDVFAQALELSLVGSRVMLPRSWRSTNCRPVGVRRCRGWSAIFTTFAEVA